MPGCPVRKTEPRRIASDSSPQTSARSTRTSNLSARPHANECLEKTRLTRWRRESIVCFLLHSEGTPLQVASTHLSRAGHGNLFYLYPKKRLPLQVPIRGPTGARGPKGVSLERYAFTVSLGGNARGRDGSRARLDSRRRSAPKTKKRDCFAYRRELAAALAQAGLPLARRE